MNLTPQEIQIIKILSNNQYHTTYQLSQSLNTSESTIRKLISSIKKELSSEGYIVTSKANKGHVIQFTSSQSKKALFDSIENNLQITSHPIPITLNEKYCYVLQRLTSSHYCKLDDLADELLMSKTSINMLIKNMKETLKSYHLEIVHDLKQGMHIIGDEINIRNLFLDYTFHVLFEHSLVFDLIYSDYHSLENQIQHILQQNHISLNDTNLSDFFIYVSLAISRIINGHILSPCQYNIPHHCDEEKAAQLICELIDEQYHIQIPFSEYERILAELFIRNESRDCFGSQDITNEVYSLFIDKTVSLFKHQSLLFIESQNRIIKMLDQMISANQYHIKLRTPLYHDIPFQYPHAYQYSQMIENIFNDHFQIKIHSSELTFLTLLFQHILMEELHPKAHALFVSSYDPLYTELMVQEIDRVFHNDFYISKIISYKDLRQEILSNYDFLISTLMISSFHDIPFICIPDCMHKENIEKLQHFLLLNTLQVKAEYSFLPSLFARTHLKSMNEVPHTFFQLLKNNHENMTPSYKEKYLNLQKAMIVEDENYLTLYSPVPVVPYAPIAVIINDTPLFYNNTDYQIFFLIANIKQDWPQYENINHILHERFNNPINKASLIQNPTYENFMTILLD